MDEQFEEIFTGEDVRRIVSEVSKDLSISRQRVSDLTLENTRLLERVESLTTEGRKMKIHFDESIRQLADCMSEKSKLLEENQLLTQLCVQKNPLIEQFLQLIIWRSSEAHEKQAVENLIKSLQQINFNEKNQVQGSVVAPALVSVQPNNAIQQSAVNIKDSVSMNKKADAAGSNENVENLKKELKHVQQKVRFLEQQNEKNLNQMKNKEYFYVTTSTHLENFDPKLNQTRESRAIDYIHFITGHLKEISEQLSLGIKIILTSSDTGIKRVAETFVQANK